MMLNRLSSVVIPEASPTRLASDPSLSGRVRIPFPISRLRLASQMDSPIAYSDLLISLPVLQWYFPVPATVQFCVFPPCWIATTPVVVLFARPLLLFATSGDVVF